MTFSSTSVRCCRCQGGVEPGRIKIFGAHTPAGRTCYACALKRPVAVTTTQLGLWFNEKREGRAVAKAQQETKKHGVLDKIYDA